MILFDEIVQVPGLARLDRDAAVGDLDAFRRQLVDMSQLQLLRRIDTSGWQHKLVLPAFTKFYAERTSGESSDEPTPAMLEG